MTLPMFESRFKSRKYIGSGGFAKVYKAFDHAKNHYVALKVADVRPEVKQFTLQREVELVNKLPPHPNIARYDACYRFDMGVAGEIDFAILKFYEDGNLEQFVTTHDLTADDVHIIIKGILRGVSFLHNNNYVHRDLKAQNILIQRDDGVWTPKITDFGLSRSMGTDNTANNSAIALSYSYAAPEQIQNRKIYKNVDIWAAGVIIYKMVAGELPFKTSQKEDGRDTQSQLELSRKIVNAELPDKVNTLPEPYQSIIKRCLVADPKSRCQNAEELLSLLDGEQPYVGNYSEDEEEHFHVTAPSPTLFVPIEPSAKMEEESTVFIASETVPSVQHKPEPSTSFPHSFSEQPPKYPPFESDNRGSIFTVPKYDEPKPDYTQIVNQPSPVGQPAEHQPPSLISGEPRNGIKWWQIGLALLIVVGVGLAYYYSTTPRSSGYIEPVWEDISKYNKVQQQNEEFKGNADSLQALSKKIERGIKVYPTDYRWTYEMAKNQAYLGNDVEAIGMLKRAAALAVDNNQTTILISSLTIEGERAFSKTATAYRSKWEQLLKGLRQKDKGLINNL